MSPIISPSGGGGSFVKIVLQHSADFSNLAGNAPVIEGNLSLGIAGQLALPATLFGNNAYIRVQLDNELGGDVTANGKLVVQSGDGTDWIERDSTAQTFGSGGGFVNFDLDGGSAGSGLSWDAGNTRVAIANLGVYSAWVFVWAYP